MVTCRFQEQAAATDHFLRTNNLRRYPGFDLWLGHRDGIHGVLCIQRREGKKSLAVAIRDESGDLRSINCSFVWAITDFPDTRYSAAWRETGLVNRRHRFVYGRRVFLKLALGLKVSVK